jgi:hypothetical protein
MKTRVHWTTREWGDLVDHLRSRGVVIEQGSRGLVSEIRKSMEAVLPPERHRDCNTLYNHGALDTLFFLARTKPDTPTPEAKIVEPVKGLAEFSTDDLLKEINRRLQAVFDVKTTVFDTMSKALRPKIEAEETVARDKLPRVLVVGPIGPQQSVLKDLFEGELDLRFVASEEGSHLVRDRGLGCQAVILWTKYIGHSHQDVAQKLVKGTSNVLEYVDGGVRSIKQVLDTYVIRQEV